jgi:hypothetical protein
MRGHGAVHVAMWHPPPLDALHGEEETVIQLLKRVRMQPSTTAHVGVVFLVGGDGGASLVPLFPGESSDPGEATIDGSARGCRPRWRHYVALLDRMSAPVSPRGCLEICDIPCS